ncbi:MAG: single-stranded-DNA-specific exonuclease RecJ [Chitinophagaceae bacterium]|nr:single-stranded-DNA-specific exonuclease RecJ [Chitinophagaceae bacterium]
MHKRWNLIKENTPATDLLQKDLNINRCVCNILVQYGIDTYEKARQYFRPQISQLHDSWLMKDMDTAVDRIITATRNKEKILIFGDYDVDGTTSVALMYQFLCSIYDERLLEFYIPHRYKEGYGISKMGIDYAKENNFSLIISLDCGIKSIELIAYAKTLEIDFIVCDHHLPDITLPPAVAILNPKQKDCNYPYKELCGCGVGFKLITALTQHLKLDEQYYLKYTDLVATAIAADIVPMNGENRILSYYGLKKINEDPCAGIKALIQLAGINSKLSINNVVFIIAPRVNAAGRMDDARKAVQLFIEKDYTKALVYAEQLHSDNTNRKEADSSITEEALAIIENNSLLINKKSSVVYKEHWHKGVVGIVASRMIEKYFRPTVVLTRSGEIVAGSARSVPGFNLYEAIHECREHLLGYGGHFAAAGLSMLPENVDLFTAKFDEAVCKVITDEQLIPEIIINAEIKFSEIKESLYKIICQMEPFGPDNMRPVFIAKNVADTGYSKIVKEQHIKFIVKQDNISLSGIGFNLAEKFTIIQSQQPFDIVFTLDENEWNGNKNIQLKVIDIKSAANDSLF